jgi:hypothetical protein
MQNTKKIIIGISAIVVLVLIVVLALNLSLKARGKSQEKIKEEISKEMKRGPGEVRDVIPQANKEANLEAELRKVLSKNDWVIYLTPLFLETQETEVDTLTFSGQMVSSKNLSSSGYAVSNYSVRKEDGKIIWEATHIDDNDDLALWRGELEGRVMRGILSLQPKQGEIEDFFFTSLPEEE